MDQNFDHLRKMQFQVQLPIHNANLAAKFFSFFNEITFLKWHVCLNHIHYMNIIKRIINEHFVISYQITSSNTHVYSNCFHEKNQFINIFLLDIDLLLMHLQRFVVMFLDKHFDTMLYGIQSLGHVL
jgi:hypothetical protein